MLKVILYSFVISQLIIPCNISAQTNINAKNLRSNFAKGENKEKYYAKLINNAEYTLKTLPNQDISGWISALRDVQSILYVSPSIKDGLTNILNLKVDEHIKLQRTSLEVAYTLFKEEFQNEIENILQKTNDPRTYILCYHYLTNSNYEQRNYSFYLDLAENKFPNFKNKNLELFINELQNNDFDNNFETPNINDLLNHNFQNGKTIVYSFHRNNRKFPGRTIIKKPNGDFVRNNDGTLFSIEQLALSFSNLPYYIPNGNTPQGVYSIVGWYISPTETIGPTPNLLVRSPFEVSTATFYHNNSSISKNWNIDDYKGLLPDSWKNYSPIYQSYFAGSIGRKLIIMHGSTDETKYFKDFPYFPLTPTRGCLSSKEIWSSETGFCIESDQVNLINAYKSTKRKKGFLVVIDIDNKEESIKIEEIEQLLKINPQR